MANTNRSTSEKITREKFAENFAHHFAWLASLAAAFASSAPATIEASKGLWRLMNDARWFQAEVGRVCAEVQRDREKLL
jgi:hypothetical protein